MIFRDNKQFELISEVGQAAEDELVGEEAVLAGIDQDNTGVALPEDVPQGREEVMRNHDDMLKVDPMGKKRLAGIQSVLTINYCIKLSYKAYYSDIPQGTELNGITEWRPFDDSSYQRAEGFYVEVYDRDTESSDDYIGLWYLNYADRSDDYTCAQFEWDQTATGEDYPDPYIRSWFGARGTGTSNIYVQIVDLSEATLAVTWRDFYSNNCSDTCYSDSLYYSSSSTATNNKRAMILAGAQRFAEEWGPITNFTHNPLKFRHINSSGSWADDRDTASIDTDDYRTWEVASHEAGHMLQMQLFEQDGLYGEACPNPHFLDVANNEACATSEGWASFVTARSYWSETAANSWPHVFGEDVETATPHDTSGCYANESVNEDLEIQVVKAFWDIIDANNESYASPAEYSDVLDSTRQTLCNIWDSLPDGTANHKDREPGETNNSFDFEYVGWDYLDDEDLDVTILHNCVWHNTD